MTQETKEYSIILSDDDRARLIREKVARAQSIRELRKEKEREFRKRVDSKMKFTPSS